MFDLKLAWRMLWRDWHSGEVRILVMALIIATASVSSVGFFVDRVELALNQQVAELLAADMIVESAVPIPEQHINQATQLQLEQARVTSFRSVVLANDATQLVEVKSVSQQYPLRGEVKVALTPFATETSVRQGPPAGEIWVEVSLLQRLSIAIGDHLSLGGKSLQVSRVLVYEPDRGGDIFSIAPRVMMSATDLAETGLLGPGSLVKYRLLLAGQAPALNTFRRWLETQPFDGNKYRVLTVKDGRPEIRTALERAQRFLGLAALLSVFLAGVAIATATRRFIQRHLDTSAILRCFGASQNRIIYLFIAEIVMIATAAMIAGCALGFSAQFIISEILVRLMSIQLPSASLQPLLSAYMTGIILLLGFAVPPLMALKQVSPLRVLRRDLGAQPVQTWFVYGAVVFSMAMLLLIQLRELALVAWMMLGLLVTLLLLSIAAYVLVILLKRMRPGMSSGWRFGLANILRRPVVSMVQIVALGIGLMVMLLLSIVRTDLLTGWENSLPEQAPNHFLINIQHDQVDDLADYLTRRSVQNVSLYPMERSRLLQINGQDVHADDYDNERARHLAAREFNLSWASQMQVDNKIVAGHWWTDSETGSALISLDEGIANTLGINLGSELTFSLNGEQRVFTVRSLRAVEWDSFNVNFFTVVPPGVLDPKQATWVTSIYLAPEQKHKLSQLIRLFPNVTVIDIDAIMSRVRAVIDRVTLAVEFIFLFTVLAGLVVLFAAIQASQDQRRHECAILKTLGARTQTLLAGLVAEFMLLGAVAGLLAGVAAMLIAWVLAVIVFHFPYEFNPVVLICGLLMGSVVVGIAGVMGTRSVLKQTPLKTLRSV